MLSPDQSRLYTDALRPPPGLRFTDAVAATYSLDLSTLLTVPLHLALFSADRPVEELMGDGGTLLEALRRTAERVTVFCEGSRTKVPEVPHTLFPLLERVVVEARAPAERGAFHPKLWLLRFEDDEGTRTRLRLLVLSRNLTEDRSWDLVLTLEGEPGARAHEGNRPLARLLARLPELALRPPAPERARRVRELADLALHTGWEPPAPFQEVRFHAPGLDGGGWMPERSERLLVISPFVSDDALAELAGSTAEPLALVSRPEVLQATAPQARDRFERVLVLAEEAELEDGEAPDEGDPGDGPPAWGLHAKAYLLKRGWRTHVVVGSANATRAALGGANVELLAELEGLSSRVGHVEDLFGEDGFGRLLMEFQPAEDEDEPDPEAEEARRALEDARRRLARAGLRIRFTEQTGGRDGGSPREPDEEGDGGWAMELVPDGPLELPGTREIRAWLVTRKETTAASVHALREGRPAPLTDSPLAHVTSFVAFELEAEAADERLRFVLSLGADGLPVEERDAAVLRDVIRNREGFLRYVLLLLAEAAEGADPFGAGAGSWTGAATRGRPEDHLPLFEELTRTYCRDPERLGAVRRLLVDLGGDAPEGAKGERVVPPEFLELWAVFEEAMDGTREEGE